ncbi:hypothetical protein ACFW0H_08555 [Pseudomonas sp. CR3202]|uniref:hypothetical protein n=1 Tax=Pseudomonas sp. CR3202 TaxID=3351532 RepID=UPI003BF45CB4
MGTPAFGLAFLFFLVVANEFATTGHHILMPNRPKQPDENSLLLHLLPLGLEFTRRLRPFVNHFCAAAQRG